MRIRNRLVLGLLLVATLFTAGCVSVPMASVDEDTQAKAFTVSPGKSNIYVYRNETFGGAILMTVTLDGRVAGQSGPQTYFLWEVEPGSHEITSVAENTSTLKFDAEAGKSYFVWQEVKMGLWMARTQLKQVDEETGRKGVAECKRAKSNL